MISPLDVPSELQKTETGGQEVEGDKNTTEKIMAAEFQMSMADIHTFKNL
jgi:hypothetical protein